MSNVDIVSLTPAETEAALDLTQLRIVMDATPPRGQSLFLQAAHGSVNSFVFFRLGAGEVGGFRLDGGTKEESAATAIAR